MTVLPLSGETPFNLGAAAIDPPGFIDLIASGAGIAQSFPGAATITSISAFFTLEALVPTGAYSPGSLSDGSTFTIAAQVWTSPADSEVFAAVPGAVVTLTPALTYLSYESIAAASGLITGLNIPVGAQQRSVLVFTTTGTPGTPPLLASSIQGWLSAGVGYTVP